MVTRELLAIPPYTLDDVENAVACIEKFDLNHPTHQLALSILQSITEQGPKLSHASSEAYTLALKILKPVHK